MLCENCLAKGYLSFTTKVNERGVVGWCQQCEEHVMSVTEEEALKHIREAQEHYKYLEEELHDMANWTLEEGTEKSS